MTVKHKQHSITWIIQLMARDVPVRRKTSHLNRAWWPPPHDNRLRWRCCPIERVWPWIRVNIVVMLQLNELVARVVVVVRWVVNEGINSSLIVVALIVTCVAAVDEGVAVVRARSGTTRVLCDCVVAWSCGKKLSSWWLQGGGEWLVSCTAAMEFACMAVCVNRALGFFLF